MKYIVANLKSNKDAGNINSYINELRRIGNIQDKLIICPPSALLYAFNECSFSLGAQDISMYGEGSYTGENNGKILKSLDVSYVLVGHNERKEYFKEDNQVLIKKIKNAFASGIEVIFFVGENKSENDNGNTNNILEYQIASIFNEFTREELKNIIVVYEPVWAIGSGDVPSIIEIENSISFIKNIINNYYELELSVLYGGGVSINDVNTLKSSEVLDGFVLGNSSIDSDELIDIVNCYENM